MCEKTDVNITSREGVTVIVFEAGSIGSAEKITVTSELIYDYIEKNKPRQLIVDFGKVKFFSSQVLGVLLNIRSRMKEYGGQVVISGINPQLYRVFRITNINRLFKFFADVAGAVSEINKYE
jgi:anti-anti-sigma factor